MSESRCPHCGFVLPQSVETTCPACHGRLDFLAFVIDAGAVAHKRKRRGVDIATVGVFAVTIVLVRAAIAYGYGNRAEGLYAGGFGVLLCIGLLASRRMLSRAGASASSDKRPLNVWQLTVLFAIGIGLFCCMRWGVGSSRVDQAEIVGTDEAGEYRNRYFHFCVPYGGKWLNTTTNAAEELAEKVRGATVQPTLLLSLSQVPGKNQDIGDSLAFIIEPLPSHLSASSGHDFLARSIPELQTGWVSPAVKWERQQEIAGMKFDRVSVRRTEDKLEYKMTFWATVERGYAVMIWGSYDSDKGLRSIEELLDQTFRFQ